MQCILPPTKTNAFAIFNTFCFDSNFWFHIHEKFSRKSDTDQIFDYLILRKRAAENVRISKWMGSMWIPWDELACGSFCK